MNRTVNGLEISQMEIGRIIRDLEIRLPPFEALDKNLKGRLTPSEKNVINNFSLGIQLIYTKTEAPNEAQYQSLAKLVNYLKGQYDIPSENILANNQINAGRKDDPWNFDWEKFNSLIK